MQESRKSLDFFMELKFCKSVVYFLNRRKMCGWPLITSVQCRDNLQKSENSKIGFIECAHEKVQQLSRPSCGLRGEGTGGSGPPVKDHKNIGFLSNTSPNL